MLSYFANYPLLIVTLQDNFQFATLKMQDIFHLPYFFTLTIRPIKLQVYEKSGSVFNGRSKRCSKTNEKFVFTKMQEAEF